jgi:hypothetical protein
MTETTTAVLTNVAALATPEERLDYILAWAEAEHAKKLAGERSEWDQGFWAVAKTDKTGPMGLEPDCGSACCLAGKAVAIVGGLFLMEEAPYGPTNRVRADYAEMPDGRRVEIEIEARKILGLTWDQGAALFEGDNDIAAVRRIIGEIKAGELYPEAGPDEGHDDEYGDDDEW